MTQHKYTGLCFLQLSHIWPEQAESVKILPKTLKCGSKQIAGKLLMLPTIIPSPISKEAPTQATSSTMVIISSCIFLSYRKLKLSWNFHQS